MPGPLVALLLAGLALAAPDAAVKQRPTRSTELPLPRDGDVAVREELDAARRAGTVQAYDLFIARHQGHELAQIAWRERQQLHQAPRPR